MRENRTQGSVRGRSGNWLVYLDGVENNKPHHKAITNSMNNKECEIIITIIKFIISPIVAGFVTWFIYKKTRRYNTVKEFRDFFLHEKEKITSLATIQDFNIQRSAIKRLDGIISINELNTVRELWHDYKKAEEKYREATNPGNGSIYISYGDHKEKILSKIDKIINYLQ